MGSSVGEEKEHSRWESYVQSLYSILPTKAHLVAEESKRRFLLTPGLLVPPENSLHDRSEGKLRVFIDRMTISLGKKEQPKDYPKISSLRDLGNEW